MLAPAGFHTRNALMQGGNQTCIELHLLSRLRNHSAITYSIWSLGPPGSYIRKEPKNSSCSLCNPSSSPRSRRSGRPNDRHNQSLKKVYKWPPVRLEMVGGYRRVDGPHSRRLPLCVRLLIQESLATGPANDAEDHHPKAEPWSPPLLKRCLDCAKLKRKQYRNKTKANTTDNA